MKLSLESGKLLLLLVLADLAFLILHLLYVYTDLLPTSYFSLARDRGYAEFFQYTKEFWIVILTLLLGIRRRKFMFLVFSCVFLYFLIDDSFALHEYYGRLLAEHYDFPALFGLRPVDLGELLVYAYFIAFFVVWVGVGYYVSDPDTRRISKTVIFLIVFFAFFGIFIDMIEIIIKHPGVSEVLKMVEELGEMLVMSFITWFVFRLDLSPAQILQPRVTGETAR